MRKSEIQAVIIACVLVACDAKAPQPANNVSPPVTAKKEAPSTAFVTPSLEPKVQFDLGKLGMTIALEKCKGAGKVTREPVKNELRQEITDEIETVTCHGIEIGIYRAHYYSPPNEIPQYLILRTHDSRLPVTYSIGARVEDVTRALGPPLRTEGANLEYQTDIEGLDNNHVKFVVEGGVVKEIVWAWFFP